jgi:hypothetical protein
MQRHKDEAYTIPSVEAAMKISYVEIGELEAVLNEARAKAKGLDLKAKSAIMHSLLEEVADKKNYILKLRS